MQIVLSVAAISDNEILLVLEKGVWILPSGKPTNETGSDADCLAREFREKLPGATLGLGKLFKTFDGESTHPKQGIEVKVYLGKVTGDLTPAAEISGARFFPVNRLDRIPMSEVTKKIVETLKVNQFLV